MKSFFEQRDASILSNQLNSKKQGKNPSKNELNNSFNHVQEVLQNVLNFSNQNANDSPDKRLNQYDDQIKFPSPLKTQKGSSGSKINFSNKKSIFSRNEKDNQMQIQLEKQEIPQIMNRYNSTIFEQSRTQRVSPQFVQHPSIHQNGSAKSYSFQTKSPLRQQLVRTPLKDTKMNIGSNSRQGMVNFSPCPIRLMQIQSSQKPLLNLGRNRMGSQDMSVGGVHVQGSDQVMSVVSKNSQNSAKNKNCEMQYYSKQNKMSDDSQNIIAQGLNDSSIKQNAEVKLSDNKKFLFGQNYFQSPFKNKNQKNDETPVKEVQNSSSQKNQNTLRGYQIISSSQKNDNSINDSKLKQQQENKQQVNQNFENDDQENDNRLSSNTTKKQFVTKFKGGSQVKSNFKLNQNSLQVKEYECMMNEKRTTDSKNYKMILQAYEKESRQNENININNIHYLSNNKNSERQSGRSGFHHTINSLSQNLKADELIIIAGSKQNVRLHQKQEFSPCRKFMHQDSSVFEKENKKCYNILNNNNQEQPIISPNFNFKGKIDSKALKNLAAIKYDQQNAESPLSQQKKRKGLFIDQNINNRFDHQQAIDNMKREFVEDPKKYDNHKWQTNQYNESLLKLQNLKKDGLNPIFYPQDYMNQNIHQMIYDYQNYFHGNKERQQFQSNFELADMVNQKNNASQSKKKNRHQNKNSQQKYNNSQNKNLQMNNFNHDSAQKLIKDKNYNGVNSNTKEEKSNEIQGHNKMIPLICPSIVNIGGRMNETFRMAQQIYKDKKLNQQSISPTSIKKSKIFCNNSGTTIKRHQYSIQETDSGQKNNDKNQIGSSGGKEYGHSGFQQTPSDMQDVQSSSNDEEGEDDFDDDEESSSQITSGDKSFIHERPHFLRKKNRKYEYDIQQQYLQYLQQQENYNFHYQHFQKDNFRIHMDGIFSASYIPKQQYPSNQYPQIQANFINQITQQQNQNIFYQQNDKQKYKSNFGRGERFSSNNKISKDIKIDQENERESYRIPLETQKREQIKSPCYQRNFQSTDKHEIKNPEIQIESREQELQQYNNSSRKEKISSQKKKNINEMRNQKKCDVDRECSKENKCNNKSGDVGQINIICPMINHYCSHNPSSEQENNNHLNNNFYGQLYQQKFQNNCMNGFPFQNQMASMDNQSLNQFHHQINFQNQFSNYVQNNQFNQNQNMMGFNNQFGLNFFPGFGNSFLNGAMGQIPYFPQIYPQGHMGYNNFMQQSDNQNNMSNQINSDNKNKTNQKKNNQQSDSFKNINNTEFQKQEESIDPNLGKRSFQTMNNNNQIELDEKIFQKRKRNTKANKQEQLIDKQQNQVENQNQQSPKQMKRRRRFQKDENQNNQNNLQDGEQVSDSHDIQNLKIQFQNTFNENPNNLLESTSKNNQITQIDVFDKPDDPKESRTIKKKSGIDQCQQSSSLQKTFFHVTPQKNFNLANNINRVGGTAPHYHSNTVAQSTQITPIRNNLNSQQKSAQYINMPIFDPCSVPSGDTLKDEDIVMIQADDQMTIGQGGSEFLNQNDQEQNFSQNQYYQEKEPNNNKDDINTDFQSNIFLQNQYSIQFISKRDNNLNSRKKQRQFSSKRSENYNEYGGQLSVKLAQQQKDFLNKQNEANIQKMIERIETETIDQKELFRKIENGETTVTQCKGCKCKGQCLKLYCECLRNNALCGQDCQCTHNGACFNNLEHKKERRYAIEQILKRNINAFDNKVDQKNVHSKGCNCKNSGCQKRYCECYERNVPCTDKCKCKQCKNDKIYSSSAPENDCHHHFHSINNPEEITFQVNHVNHTKQQSAQNEFENQFKSNQNKESEKLNQSLNYQANNNGFKLFELVEENNAAQNQKSQFFESQKQMQVQDNINETNALQNSIQYNLENKYQQQLNDQNNLNDLELLQSNEVLQNFDNEQVDSLLQNDENNINNGNIQIEQNQNQVSFNENSLMQNKMIQKSIAYCEKYQKQIKHYQDFDQINCSFGTMQTINTTKKKQDEKLNYTFVKQNEKMEEKEDDCNLVTFNNQLTIVKQNENNLPDNSLHFIKNLTIYKSNLFETRQDLIRKKQRNKKAEDLIRKSQILQQDSFLQQNENLSQHQSSKSEKQANDQHPDELIVQSIEQFQTPGFSNKYQINGNDLTDPIQSINKDNIKVNKFNQNSTKTKNESPSHQNEQLNENKNLNNKKDNARSNSRSQRASELQKQSGTSKQRDIQTRQTRNNQQANEEQEECNDPIILEIQLKHEDNSLPKQQDKSAITDTKTKSKQKKYKLEKMETRHQRKLRQLQELNQQPLDQIIQGDLQ